MWYLFGLGCFGVVVTFVMLYRTCMSNLWNLWNFHEQAKEGLEEHLKEHFTLENYELLELAKREAEKYSNKLGLYYLTAGLIFTVSFPFILMPLIKYFVTGNW